MVAKVNSASVRARALAALPVVIGLAVFVTALEVLRLELHTVSWHEVSSDVLSIPLPYLLLALAITACNYLVLAGYDVLAFKYVGRAVALGPVVGVSMLAYAVANSVGFAMLSGASIRYRFYSRWGVTAEELSRIVFSYSITFWLGLLALGGFALVLSPLPGLAEWPGHQYVPAAGWTLMLLVAGFLLATAVRRALSIEPRGQTVVSELRLIVNAGAIDLRVLHGAVGADHHVHDNGEAILAGVQRCQVGR